MKAIATLCLVLVLAAAPEMGQSAETAATLADLDQALATGDFAALDAAVKAVCPAAAGGPALGILWTGLKGNDPAVRRRAAYALTQVDPQAAKQAIPRIVEALRDNEPKIRGRVALALGQMGAAAREAIPTLAELLKDQDPHVRASAVRALGSMGAEAKATVPMLVALLRDPVPPVRGMTAAVLGQLGPVAQEAAPALQTVQATDADADVRAEAASALEEIAPPVHLLVDALDSPDTNRRLWAVSVLIEKGPQAEAAVARLAEALRHDVAASVRAGAAYALSKIGARARSACPALVEALRDREARVRTAAAIALGWLGSETPGAGPALAAALKDEDAVVAASAATALGNLGPAVEAAVPALIDMLKQANPLFRQRAVNVLARIGPAVRPAAAVLLDTLKDNDPGQRHEAARALVAVGPQASAPLSALLEALHCTETDADCHVRAWACLSLGLIGPPAAEAVVPLLAALQDDDASVRTTAGIALGRIGPPAVVALVKALDHLDPRVRAGAAYALGSIEAGARRALSNLRASLRDEDTAVSLAAAVALTRIAIALQLAQDTRTVADLEETLQALEEAKGTRLAAEQRAAWAACVAQTRAALQGLHTVQSAHVLDRLVRNPWFPWLAGGLLYASVLLVFWSLLLRLRPLLLLRINDTLRRLPHLPMPGGGQVSLHTVLLVGLFPYRRRVLDAWVAQHLEAFRNSFQAKHTVREHTVYVPMPVVLDGQVIPEPTPRELGEAFGRKRGCLLIWGEGGAGKTTLACQVGRWALAADPSERLCEHLMLPVLIEHDLDLKSAEGKPPFVALTEAVRGQLQVLIGEAALSEELLEHLLRQRRILVIVDHFSEASAATREAVCPGHADFPAHALVVTSRSEEALEGVPRMAVQPLRLGAQRMPLVA